MRNNVKKIFTALPTPIKRTAIRSQEMYSSAFCLIKEKINYSIKSKQIDTNSIKKRILIYHISGLNIGGTEKTLQLLANGLSEEFEVFFMYSMKNITSNRLSFINKKVTCIEFTYNKKEPTPPFYIEGMSPHIKEIIQKNNIELLITADGGHSHYPINTITNIPIIFINIFGSPSLQPNIKKNLFISQTVQNHSEKYTGERPENKTLYIPVTKPPEEATEVAIHIRKKLNFSDTDFIFGRIGRDTDSIYDPIGIESFKEVVKEFPQAHYLIMSPPPLLVKKVLDESIPNVHFLPPSGEEKEIWGFHHAIDCLAHFRYDGETLGLNIAESMYAGNPIISHKSHIWNAHLEYLTNDFSLVVNKDDTMSYIQAMKKMITLKQHSNSEWINLRNNAQKKATIVFSEKNYINQVSEIIKQTLS